MKFHSEEKIETLYEIVDNVEEHINDLKEKKKQGEAMTLLCEERAFVRELIHKITQ